MQNFALEQLVPFSQCELWDKQRDFYKSENINAWNNKIPFYASSNPYIANAYAHTIVRYTQDLIRTKQCNLKKPIYILEMGAGAGLFSFYILKALRKLQQQLALTKIKFKYIMADLTLANIEFWERHPNLQPYLQEGLLDFAYYDSEEKQPIYLKHAAIPLTKLKNPLVVIANYVFDSLKHDFFRIKDERLQIGMINRSTKLSDAANITSNQSIAITDIDPGFTFKDISLPYYDNTLIDDLLETYRISQANTSFTFPIGALTCLEQLREINKNILLLASDKGYVAPIAGYLPELVVHDSAFSMMVNFTAIADYAKRHQGDCYNQTLPQSINTGLFVFNNSLTNLYELQQAAITYLDLFSPGSLLEFSMQLDRLQQTCSIHALMTYLAFICWDNYTFDRCLPSILIQLKACKPETISNILVYLEQIAANFYYMPKTHDTLSNIGTLLYELQQYERALSYFKQSLQYFGETDQRLYNIALCHYFLEQYEEAETLFTAAIKLNADNIKAFGWLGHIQKRKLPS
ncbi:MAG: hypothetical protein K0S11_85 [Gammaproteobacteria bacterium]|jgi:tetratricopeptide (TPR) repeat protein|nr:hypothetical protein [Gammaproteobacteria bacterium]